MYRTSMYVVMVLGLAVAGAAQGTIYDAGFETLPLGSISTPENGWGVGDPANTIDGRWRTVGAQAVDPSVVNTIAHTGAQSLRLSRWTAGQNAVGWTTGASVPQGDALAVSFWANPVDGGSWTFTVNNYDYIQTNQPVALYITPAQDLRLWEWRADGTYTWHYTGVYLTPDVWTGIKMVVTDWGDGTSTIAGRGFYDAYVDTGSGWTLAGSGIGFDSSKLYGGVNAVFVSPQAPSGSISGYIDDVSIVPEPMTLLLLGLGALGYRTRRGAR